MTDYNIRGKNKITGFALRMHVKNVESFDPEVQQEFEDLIKALECPKEDSLNDREGKD